MKINIKKLSEEYIKAACLLEKQTLNTAWAEEDIRSCLTCPNAVYYIALDDELLVGICCFYIVSGDAQMINIAVHPDYRGCGIGAELMDTFLGYADKENTEAVSLEVGVENTPAIALYEKKGFIKAGIRKKFYSTGEDAYVMIYKRRY
ncbi:MAG: ribosomal-protein-alanine N-acetyltransferase [Clostridiales bacterium GWF2_38_85]|nr:MAG: ribosomal-protein-alanine N-acetyltransferase [Clostridiales bacterium GWF2_38_85]